MPPLSFFLLFFLAMIFGFLDGFHNSANVVATVISSRAMRPRPILILAAIAEFIGPFVFGAAVARTIGADLVEASSINLPVVTSAVGAAIAWKMITWWKGIPASSSHSLLGGLIGAVIISGGAHGLQAEGLQKIVLALIVSPFLGLVGGYLVMRLTIFVTRSASPRINSFFKRIQMVTAFGLALSHGSNNVQKVVGILVMGLLSAGVVSDFTIPSWIVLSAAGAMALGTLIGGQRIMRTIGARFYKIRPVHGFAAQLTSSATIFGASLLGGPVSTTQVVSSSVVGVGSAERLSKVRWGVFTEIGLAWLLTVPASAVIATILYIPAGIALRWLA